MRRAGGCQGRQLSFSHADDASLAGLVSTTPFTHARWPFEIFLHSEACADHISQDIKDDEKAGVKSMPVHLGKAIRPVLTLFDATFFVCLLWAGYLNDQRLPFYMMSVLTPFLLCLWHIWSFDHNDPGDCWKTFTVRLAAIAMYHNFDMHGTPGRSPRRGDGLRWIDRRSPLQTLVQRWLKIQFHSFLLSSLYMIIFWNLVRIYVIATDVILAHRQCHSDQPGI